eukprot:scaffold178879_cov18-Prasinocladus_malaysianus.AAC.1
MCQYDLHQHDENLRARAPNARCEQHAADGRCLKVSGTPGGKPWYKGSQWKLMSRDFVEYALDSAEVGPIQRIIFLMEI